MEAYGEVYGSLAELRDPSGQEAMSAIERIAQAPRSPEATAADYRTALSPALPYASPGWQIPGLGLVVSQNAEATRAAWEQARPELEAWLLGGKSVSRADEVLWSFFASDNSLESSLRHAEYNVDRLLCEGSGSEWTEEGTCI